MIKTFYDRTANGVWDEIVKCFSIENTSIKQQGRGGEVNEFTHVGITITDPYQRWIVSRTPPINIAFSIAEIIWIINGRNDSHFLNYFNSQLPKYAGYGDKYHGAYGFRLRKHFGIDQLERAYLTLKNNPVSRQVVLQIWDCNIDFPNDIGDPADKDIPCNIISMLKIRNGKLNWTQIVRSNDLFLGLPYNIIQFTTLQEIMAGWLDIEVGEYNHFSDSLHVYKIDEEKLYLSDVTSPSQNIDRIGAKKKYSDRYFREISNRVDKIIESKGDYKSLKRISCWKGVPQAYKNMLLILCAESARRNKLKEEYVLFLSQCTNPIYKQIWEKWILYRPIIEKGKILHK